MTIFGRPINELFLAECFRRDDRYDTFRASVSKCLVSSIDYYTNILSAVAAFIAFCYIIKAGYMMFTAFGDEAKYASAKKTLQYAVIGFAIAVLSYFIIHLFIGLLGYTE
ncbi:MAG: pilin [Candidatus Berkelbacteria bacterium]|nr:pilin [Candidatus Berkelbacteria bacterium]